MPVSQECDRDGLRNGAVIKTRVVGYKSELNDSATDAYGQRNPNVTVLLKSAAREETRPD